MTNPNPEQIMKNNSQSALENNTEFQSERLTFKPTWYVNSEELAKIANDLEIAVAVGENFPFPYTFADADKFKKYTESAWQTGKEYNFGIYDKETGGYAGNIGFKISPDGREVTNIGYWLGRDYHGKGLATETLKEFLKFIWDKFPEVEKIKASAFDYNIASQNVLEKCGFVKTGEVDEPKELRNGMTASSVKYILNK